TSSSGLRTTCSVVLAPASLGIRGPLPRVVLFTRYSGQTDPLLGLMAQKLALRRSPPAATPNCPAVGYPCYVRTTPRIRPKETNEAEAHPPRLGRRRRTGLRAQRLLRDRQRHAVAGERDRGRDRPHRHLHEQRHVNRLVSR